MESELHTFQQVLERVAESGDIVEFGEWVVNLEKVGDTIIGDVLPQTEQERQVAVVKKREKSTDDSSSCSQDQEESMESEPGEEVEQTTISNGYRPYQIDLGLLAVEDARNIVSLYTMIHSPMLQENNQNILKQQPLLPLWIPCDGQDPEKTVLIGCERLPKSGSDSDPGSMVIITVTSEGPIHNKTDVPTLTQLIQEGHNDDVCKLIQTKGFARFEVVGALGADTSLNEDSDSSYIAVECAWTNVKKVLETPHNATCELHIRAVPGDLRHTPLSVFKELSTLVTFAEGLKTGEVSWTPRDKKESIHELISKFLDEIKEGPVYKRRVADEANDVDSKVSWKTAFDRSDLDFTERLWNIFRENATCYDDIVKGFNLVVNELNKGELQPMVLKSNQTTLAKQIRLLYKDPTHCINLDQFPMLLLVEMGIDKLQRDYNTFFIAQQLTTLRQLEWYLPSVDSSTPEDLVTQLRCLHCILEHYVLASRSLGLPTNNILTLIRISLEYYKNNSLDDQHTFVLPVEVTNIQNLYQNKLPALWRVTIQSGARGRKTSSVYQLSNKPLLDTPNTADLTVDDVAEDQESFTYYGTHVTQHCIQYL